MAVPRRQGAAQPAARNDAKQLKQAHVFLRHGARTPVFVLNEDDESVSTRVWRGKCAHVNVPPGIEGAHVLPRVPGMPHEARMRVTDLDGSAPRPSSLVDSFQLYPTYGDCRAGQLTDLGAEQSAALGRVLKGRYGTLVATALKRPNGLYLRSSNVGRCMATLAFVLGEMDLDEAALPPVRTAHAHSEILYPNHHCLLTNQLLKAAAADWKANPSAEARALQRDLKARLPRSAYDALRLDQFNFVRVRDFFSTYRAHGLAVPWDVPAEVCDRAERLGSMQVARYLYHEHASLREVAAEVGVGALLGVVANSVLGSPNAASRNERAVVSLISGHDTTLMPVMSVFGWDGQSWPGFCYWVALELWGSGDDNDEDDEVRVVYNGDVVRVLSLDEFRALALPLVPADWKQACLQTRTDLPALPPGENRGDHW